MAMEHGVTDSSSIRAAFAPHLPHLRRYARALTGTQRSGDAHVRQTLEAMLSAPDAVDIGAQAANLGARVALFRLFTAVSGAAAAGPDTLAAGSMQALLLIEVEGFSLEEVSVILGEAEAAIIEAVEKAKAAIAETLRSRVLIIEDEPLIAMHLEQIVEDMGHDVAGMAMTHKAAIAKAHEVKPELVLADIQLADGSSGLEAAREILQHFDVPVIFITAYPERLLTGERPEPTFLVTKPFKVETVIATIGQALLARAFKATDAA
jgi:CheY-like chemotaxis protein/DNA-directed RNA polymerase specialized sigma24 family protein